MGSKNSKLEEEKTQPSTSRYIREVTFDDISTSTSAPSSSTAHSAPPPAPHTPPSASSSDNDAEILNNALINLLEKLEELSSSLNTNKDIHYCICDICKKENFTEYRYKCLTCNDYDLCGK